MTPATRDRPASMPSLAAAAGAVLLALLVCAGAARAQISFGLPVAIHPDGENPASLAVADLDADGHVDVLYTRTSGFLQFSVTSLMGAGDGRFESVPSGVTDGYVQPLQAVEDMTGDGLPDLLLRVHLTNGLLVLRPGNGDGSFAEPVATLGGGPGLAYSLLHLARPARLREQPTKDLVVLTSGDSVNGVPARVYVLHFDGAGFAPAGQHDVPYGAVAMLVDDLDGDGLSDVVALFPGGDVRVFLADGAGGLAAGPALQAGAGTADVKLADLDADGRLDLAAVSTGAGGAQVDLFLGNGDGSFSAGASVPVPDGSIRIDFVDADGDGAPDLVATRITSLLPFTSHEVFVLRGFCDASFGAPLSVFSNASVTGPIPADVDDDGREDLVFIPAGEFVSVMRSTSDGPTYAGLGGGLAGTSVGGAQASSLDLRGSLATGEPYCWALVDALPSASAVLVLGLDELGAPFKGGIFVPQPLLLVAGLTVPADGRLALNGSFPALPGGFDLVLQFWYVDAGGPVGFAASPGARASVP